jgi:hypothetical protein
MNDLVFTPVELEQWPEPLPEDMQKRIQHGIEKGLDELLESEWFVNLVDQRVRMVIEIMNEESEAAGLSGSIIKDVLSDS